MDESPSQPIDLIALEELNISSRLRRELSRLGAGNLRSAFELDVRTVVQSLSQKTEQELEGYRELMSRSPDKLRETLLRPKKEPQHGHKATGSTLASDAVRRPSASHVRKRPTGSAYLPNQQFAKTLLEFETSAKKAFAPITTHAERAIVAETFPSFDIQFADYREAWISFFRFYSDHHALPQAFDIVEAFFPFSYLVFVTDAARRLFDRSAIWEPIFNELGIDGSQTSEIRFKSIFFDNLHRLGFRVYDKDETALRFKYTALLHAGLSEEAWYDLWDSTLIPLSKEGDFGLVRDGYDILEHATRDGGQYAVKNQGVRRMLAKSPRDLVAPLLESGLKTARQWQSFSTGLHTNNSALLSSRGMSADAMCALARLLEKSRGQSVGARSSSRTSSEDNLFYWISDPALLIDFRRYERPVCVRIEGQRLSEFFAGRVFEIYVNEQLVDAIPVRVDHRGHMIPKRMLWVDLAEQYIINIKIVEDREGVRHEVASRTVSYLDEREGIFEFCGPADTSTLEFQPLRRPKGKSVRRAYIVYPGYSIHPGGGMARIPSVQVESDYSVVAFEVEDGGSAEVVNSEGNSVLWLQERFLAHVEKTWLMGKVGSADLFGSRSASGDDQCNPYLPTVEVEAIGMPDARSIFDVRCLCDGRRVYPRIKLAGLHGASSADDARGGSRLLVVLSLTILPAFIRQGTLTITHKMTGKKVLVYRFSTIPIKGLHLTAVSRNNDELRATYAFTCVSPLLVSPAMGEDPVLVDEGARGTFERPLADCVGRVGIAEPEAGGLALEADLMLAGISVAIPSGMEQGKSALTLSDLIQTRQEVKVSVRANRSFGAVKRGYYLGLGPTPVAHEDGLESTVMFVHNLSEVIPQMGVSSEVGVRPSVSNLRLAVSYGWPEYVNKDIKSGDIVLGYIRHAVVDDVRMDSSGDVPCIRIACPSGLRWQARFNYHTSDAQYEDVGESGSAPGCVTLPHRAESMLSAGREVDLEITCRSPLQLRASWNIVQVVRLAQAKPQRSRKSGWGQEKLPEHGQAEERRMEGKNAVSIEGRVKRSEGSVNVRSGVNIMNFCLMIPDPLNKNADVYVDCFATTGATERLSGFVRAGELIGVEGSLTFRTYTDAKGYKRSGIFVYVDDATPKER